MAGRRILVAGYAPPRPDRESGSRRLLHQLEFLAEAGWAITFVTTHELVAADAEPLRQLGIPVHDGTATPLERLLVAGRFDVALLAFWQVAELYIPVIRAVSPETRVVVDSVDLQFVRESRRIFVGDDFGGAAPLLDVGYGRELAGELNAYAAADAVLAVSRVEAELVGRLTGRPELGLWAPDAEEIACSPLPFAERAGLLFVGSFRHPPNLDALGWFCSSVLPLLDPTLLASDPVLVVGDGLDETAARLARGRRGVSLVGWAPSLEPYLHSAKVSIVPLRYGAGTKRKVIQSLLAGTPVVATRVGLEGLDLRDGDHVLVADTAEGLADALRRLLADERLWSRLAGDGREALLPVHGRDAAGRRFLDTIEEAAARVARLPLLPPGDRGRFSLRLRTIANLEILPKLRELVARAVPDGAELAVLSEGAADLLRLGEYRAHHFPPTEDGVAPPHPADSHEAVSLLGRRVGAGTEFLVVPETSSWWLDHYPGLRRHLDSHPSVTGPAGVVYDLRGAASPVAAARPLPSEGLAARLVAFYLPQFHPIPENDAWWGPGFTEWANVAAARPLFGGHEQPHVPAELGFYDLRLAETRVAQAELARGAGISAFCYYHYWFAGKRLLERPFEEMLASGEPNFPFCLCWANEPWTRRWDGRSDEVLQAQTYSEDDDREHIRALLPAFADPRALTVDEKPLFLVYRAKDLPDPATTADLWRREARAAGLPGLHLVAVETGWDAGWDATRAGFDAKVLFQPQFTALDGLPRLGHDGPDELRVWQYDDVWPSLAEPEPVPYRRYETVCTSWDNSPRAGRRGWVLHGSTPESYARWLRRAVERAQAQPPKHRLVFVNAWNEWAEGAHLEPDLRSGRAYLDATRAVLGELSSSAPPRRAAAAAPVPLSVAAADPTSGPDPEPDAKPGARAIAFYLPQFHPIPENDEWWGPGFTEWRNVVRARPLFVGHAQPRVPTLLGHYDLRVPEVRAAQAELARRHGIEAFCYYHYWFEGRRLLERPFEEVLASGEPDFPFCLCWANESWSRRWLGEERNVLAPQTYSVEDDLVHARWLARAFADPRYLRVHGRPLFLVYRPNDLPDPVRLTTAIRVECERAELADPFLLGVNSWQDVDYREHGFDGSVDFEPWLGALHEPLAEGLKLYDYADARRRMRRSRDFPVYPTVAVGWDNSPRRGEDGIVLADATPAAFEAALRETVATTLAKPLEDRLVFLNAWNEWAEGAYLEPDREHGLGRLEAVWRVLLQAGATPGVEPAATAALVR